ARRPGSGGGVRILRPPGGDRPCRHRGDVLPRPARPGRPRRRGAARRRPPRRHAQHDRAGGGPVSSEGLGVVEGARARLRLSLRTIDRRRLVAPVSVTVALLAILIAGGVTTAAFLTV